MLGVGWRERWECQRGELGWNVSRVGEGASTGLCRKVGKVKWIELEGRVRRGVYSMAKGHGVSWVTAGLWYGGVCLGWNVFGRLADATYPSLFLPQAIAE